MSETLGPSVREGGTSSTVRTKQGASQPAASSRAGTAPNYVAPTGPAAPSKAQATASPSASTSPFFPAGVTGTPGEPARMRELLQPIAADFYNVVDPEGRPIAGLLVLLDGKNRPVRAELHLGGSASDESGRQAIRQSQHILEERYFGPESLPLQVWQSFLRSEQLHVPLPPPDKHPLRGVTPARPRSDATPPSGLFGTGIPWQVAAAGLAALVVVGLIWWMVSALRSNTTVATTPSSGGITVPVPEGTIAATSLTEDAAAVTTSQDSLTGAQLPPSQWANPDIVPGRRVRMVPGFSQPVLDEPGTASGLEIGIFGPNMTVEVVGGPVQLAGDADTIVWLEVDIGGGVTGWVAANTSTQALLEVAD